ncbi:hypothetical protein NDU88_009848 [Pleurodeles waltl]|uniref:Uncharacterized protein n=1 Tax=Pleurodeles waltl TaxID=8319 RepID=A0AAV7QYN8_PLEWA|nr:hypothetical protein NDU88_009848 [Pleurodeles waltl]
MEADLRSLVTELTILRDEHRKLKDCVTEGEQTLAVIQPQTLDNLQAIEDLQEYVHLLEEHASYTKGCYWRCNVCIIGMREDMEGRDPLKFLDTWFHSFVPASDLSYFSLERAHRVPACRHPQ